MTLIEQDIRSIPEILHQTYQRIADRWESWQAALEGPLLFLGCGSSYYVGVALAALYEQERHAPAQALFASDYLPRLQWTHLAISRTGATSELVDALRRAREVGAGRILLLVGERNSEAEKLADVVLPLEFAPEQGVIQTRFVVAALQALRLLIGGESVREAFKELPERIEQALVSFDPRPWLRFEHVVYLGRGWRYGLACAAALNLQETALLVPEYHQTLDYRHGPIASADERTLVWCFDPGDDPLSAGVIADVRRTGATVQWTQRDPLIALAESQLFALHKALSRGVNPEQPRNLSRAVIF